MTISDTEFIAAFDAEAGDAVTLTDNAQKLRWFNRAQARMFHKFPTFDDISWLAGDRRVALPADFVQLSKLVYDNDVCPEPWVVVGRELVIHDPDGALHAGSARAEYEGEWPDLTASDDSRGTKVQDEACLAYALSRFFKRLSSSRAYYKRYATLVGANAVSEADLQAEADRHYNDFLDARDDIPPPAPVGFTVE